MLFHFLSRDRRNGLPYSREKQAEIFIYFGRSTYCRSGITCAYTLLDGDTLFALSTGASGRTAHPVVLATMATEAVARATLRAVLMARSLTTAEGLHLPGCAQG